MRIYILYIYIYIYIIGVMGHGLFLMTDLYIFYYRCYNDSTKYIYIYIIYIIYLCINVANRPSADGLHTLLYILI